MRHRERLAELRTWWRRRRLLRAYSRVFTARTGKSVGFTSTIHAYHAAERDGVLKIDEDEGVVWKWPDDQEGRA